MQRSISQTPSPNTLGRTGYQVEENIRSFLHKLRHCGLPSIDQFLSYNEEFSDWGRRFIAAGLMPQEFEAMRSGGACGDWHSWMFQQLSQSGSLDTSSVHFISFNYDRLFELSMALMASQTFQTPFPNELEKLRRGAVIHVYGSFSCDAAERAAHRLSAGYEVRHNELSISVSMGSAGIKVMPSQRSAIAPILDAQARILLADRLIFLGFSFDIVNLKRLGVHVSDANWTAHKCDVFASAFGIQGAERTKAEAQIGRRITFGHIEGSCLHTLRSQINWA